MLTNTLALLTFCLVVALTFSLAAVATGTSTDLPRSALPGRLVHSLVPIVAGHITGATAAHDRALKLLPERHQVTGQLGMLVTMVGYTGTGLYLLFGS